MSSAAARFLVADSAEGPAVDMTAYAILVCKSLSKHQEEEEKKKKRQSEKEMLVVVNETSGCDDPCEASPWATGLILEM